MIGLMKSILIKSTLLLAALFFCQTATACQTVSAGILDLSTYTLSGTYRLPRGASYAKEASAVTYNWDTGTLFVVGDEGDAIVEVSLTGETIGNMILDDFDDTEGLTYAGNGQFVITEERLREAFILTYSADATVDSDDLASVDLGSTIGNIGIEGISYDYATGAFYTVKEKDDQEVNINSLDFTTGEAQISSLFDTDSLGLADLSDIQSLSMLGLTDNLLILSQESKMLLEVDMAGNILSSYDLDGLVTSIEGVTVDETGDIYLVAENGTVPLMYTLSAPSPVPLPGTLMLLGSALAGFIGLKRRSKHV